MLILYETKNSLGVRFHLNVAHKNLLKVIVDSRGLGCFIVSKTRIASRPLRSTFTH